VLPREVLTQIIEPRVEEIFQAVHHVLKETGYVDMLASGLVLCGGSTLLEGMPELAEQIVGLPTRRATPIGVGGLADVVKSPAYATAVGLVKYGAERLTFERTRRIVRPVMKTGPSLRGKLGDWFREVF
jgi:cell division protein FtsA